MKRVWWCIPLLSFCFSSCGYKFQGSEENFSHLTTISIPYIKGDWDGKLNRELVRAISTSSVFEYRQHGGSVILEASVVGNGSDRIGYRYDRDPNSGARRVNIVGTENRRKIGVLVQLVDSYSQEVILGPITVESSADYDYVDENSIRDLTFNPPGGSPQTVIDFSLGQLDSVNGASDDTEVSIYQVIARKILNGISSYDWEVFAEPESQEEMPDPET